MHAVFAPAVPRVGEYVTPQNDSQMQVVAVEHHAIGQGNHEGISQPYLYHIFSLKLSTRLMKNHYRTKLILNPKIKAFGIIVDE
jgi:hypothetical protein